MISYNKNGTVTLTDDANPSRTQTLPVGADVEQAAAEFFGPGPRRLIPKSTVTARVIAMGKIDAVMAALDSDKAAYVRWFSPDWPNVYADDEGMLAVLAAIGCTADEIAEVTAA